NSIETDTLKAGQAGADTTTSVLAAGPYFRRVWSKTQGVLGDTLTLSSSVSGLTFLKRRRYWSATTGTLDSIMVGTSTVRLTSDDELVADSIIAYPAYTGTASHTSTHSRYQLIFNNAAVDSVFQRLYAYDSLGRLTSEARKYAQFSGWTYDVGRFAYNGAGALRAYQRATTTNTGCTLTYGCVLADTTPYVSCGYPRYDAALNLLTRVDSIHGNAKDSATFALGDRVTSWLGATYTYDADGNRATRTVGSTVTTYTWDASGRLLQVKTGSDSVTYAYNALGDLARRSTTGHVDRWFVWEAGQLVEELDSTAQHRVNAFAYRPGTDQPLARITGDAAGTIEFVQQDERGDVLGLTNGTMVTQSLHFGPWGNLEWQGGDSLAATRLGWKGLVFEGGTAQLYYVRSRWYDPQSRSFLSEDPMGLSGGRNTYGYADNDPVNGWDPSGMDEFYCHPRYIWTYM
ncbi:MAG: RHS repeat-associated core domain-containing protein, partial [Gemmatimonadaceae bacterium]